MDDRLTSAERTREQELDRIARLGATRLHSPFEVKVVGISFVPGYPGNLLAVLDTADSGQVAGEGLAAVLVRNPSNPTDANAVQVHVPAVAGGMVGHLPSPLAARLAPELDAGIAWQAEVVAVLRDPSHPDRPGITIQCWRIDA